MTKKPMPTLWNHKVIIWLEPVKGKIKGLGDSPTLDRTWPDPKPLRIQMAAKEKNESSINKNIVL